MSDNKRIAKNTLFLYFRMILIMGVTLYTSRVVLDKLGVDDYGLYNVVGGVVGMLSFINGTLSIGTMRFLTTELGRNDVERLHKTFNTAFYTHFALSLILALLLETVGLWVVYNKLVIPPERLDAAIIAYHISIATSIVSITQVPYTSLIMAHERMGIYAYISIFEAIAKLIVVYLLSISHFDRLVFYAILMAVIQVIVAMLYRFYCRFHFCESRLIFCFDKPIFKSMMGFSGWNIIANLTETLKLQGVLVLINMFFAPAVAAAQAIANQVSGAMMQFVNNFRTAINPQIIKLFAAGDFESSRRLTLNTTVYCFDLTLMLGLPAMIVMEPLMHVWLVEVPEYAVIFTQWILFSNIIGTFGAAFYIPMMAANKVRSNSIAAVFLGIGQFIILFFLLKMGLSPMWVQYMNLIMVIGFSIIVKPVILYREIDYPIKDLLRCYFECVKVFFFSLFLTLIAVYFVPDISPIIDVLIKGLLAFFASVLSSYFFLDASAKKKLHAVLVNKYLISRRSMS